jgi:hypothetical protein
MIQGYALADRVTEGSFGFFRLGAKRRRQHDHERNEEWETMRKLGMDSRHGELVAIGLRGMMNLEARYP